MRLLRRCRPVLGRRAAATLARQLPDLASYQCVGLDLDNTLCQYQVQPLMEMTYERCLVPYLVEQHGFPADVFPRMREQVGLCARGLVLDTASGNLLKLAPDGKVLRATHGSRQMSDADLSDVYGPTGAPSAVGELALSVLDPPSGRLRTFRDFFDVPAVLAAAALVDAADAGRLPAEVDYSAAAAAVQSALVHMYARHQFAADVRGSFFSRLRADTPTLAHPCSAAVLARLRQLRRDGTILFLVTSSSADYARHMARLALGTDDWFDYFDLVVTYARKPSFFTGRAPFLSVDCDDREMSLVSAEELRPGVLYSQGNWSDLYALLQRLTGRARPHCLYVGDNLAYDTYPVAAYTRCDAALVLEELEAEEGVSCEHGHPTTVRRSDVWGPMLREGDSETMWGAVARRARVCVPRLDYLLAQ